MVDSWLKVEGNWLEMVASWLEAVDSWGEVEGSWLEVQILLGSPSLASERETGVKTWTLAG